MLQSESLYRARTHRKCNQFGATLVEAAIVMLPLLLVTLGTACLGYDLYVWGVLNKGAHDGINVAVKFERLLNGQGIDPTAQQLVLSAATSLAERLSLDQNLTAEVFLPGQHLHPTQPTLPPGETFSSMMLRFPIVVRLTRPSPIGFLGFFHIQLVAIAIGYREFA